MIFIGLFIVLPAVAFRWVGRSVDSSILVNALEGVFRVALFLGYLLLIGRTKDIRRVFEYHGAEHKTIAAYEHDEPLVPERVDGYSTLHVRCGTNFLLLVMVITIFVFALFGNPGLWWRIRRGSWRSRSSRGSRSSCCGSALGSRAPGSSTRSWCRDCGCRRSRRSHPIARRSRSRSRRSTRCCAASRS